VVMAHWSASRPIFVHRLSRCRTQRRDWYSISVDLIISRMHSSCSLHLPREPERILKIAIQTYRVLHGDATQYLRQFTPFADIPSRERLRSSSSDDLLVPAVRLPTIDAFKFKRSIKSGSHLPFYCTSRLPCRRRSHMERSTGRCHLNEHHLCSPS